ncbi:hypothetical protein BUALT_Bualt01G0232900 [Buddleja alternifolia]|uniref:WRKY domain-containing protein n=1 Tax=Buddleja alternifolia TaxID=168488 RepID=A0AAV6YDQ0_9LAMI|nr:hypothetical protein BUALT_Bualt01G0232900 [Buddleja alternifolia]
MEDDWDLHAVVRGCAAAAAATITATAAANTTTSSGQLFTTTPHQNNNFSTAYFQDLFEPRRENYFIEELHDLYKPFFPKSQQILLPPQNLPISPLSVLENLQEFSSDHQIMKQLLPNQTQKQSFLVANSSKTSFSHNPTPRSKRRKNNLKKICHVAAESLSSDMWSWRKYGQKPIKGSPYPRGYYRCSTLKGCMARKQVERNRSDPGMFIVTYTGEHSHPMPTHRNSLAGSTRQKPSEIPNSDDSNKPSCSPVPEKVESSREELAEAEDEDDDFSTSNMAVVDDDFFSGLEDFTVMDAGDCISGHVSTNLQFPWAATTTAGGG